MSVRNSKALIGGLFIQYCAYAAFYLLDEFKEMAPQMYKEIPQGSNNQNQQQQQEEDDNDAQARPNARRGNQGPQQRNAGKLAKIIGSDRELSKEEQEDFKKFEENRMQSITNEIVEYYPRLMLFHTLVVTFCAIRSPTDTAVILTYFCIILRILMVFGWYCRRKFIYIGGATAEGLINVILFLITLSYSPY